MATTIGDLLVKLGLDLSDFSKGQEDAIKLLEQQARAFGNLGKALGKGLDEPLAQVGKTSDRVLGEMDKDIKKITADTGEMVKLLGQSVEALTKMGKAGRESGEKTRRAFSEATSTVRDFSTGLQDVGKTFSIGLTAPLAAMAGYSVKAFADFEGAMNKVLALGGNELAPLFKQMEKQAMDLGAATKYSAKQAAEGMGELVAAGFSATETMKALPGVLSLAATDAMGLGQAAEIASGILKGFGMDAGQMGDVADILAKTSADSAASVTSLGNSFQYIGPVAKAAGLSFLDTSAALGVLANAGIKGESGGTAVRSMMLSLISPSKEAKAALQAMGIVITDHNGKLKDMAGLIEALQPLQNNLAAGEQIFGKRISDVLPLLTAHGAAYDTMRASVSKYSGAAKEMADTMNSGILGNWEKFTGAMETTGIAIGKSLAPAVNMILEFGQKMFDVATNLAQSFGGLPVGIQAAAIAFAALAAAAGPAMFIFGGMISTILKIKEGGAILKDIGAAMKLVGIDAGAASSTVKSFFSSFSVGSAMSSASTAVSAFGNSILTTFRDIPKYLRAAQVALAEFAIASQVAMNAGLVNIRNFAAGAVMQLGNFVKFLGSITIVGSIEALTAGFVSLGASLAGGFTVAVQGAGAALAALFSGFAIGTAGIAVLVAVVVAAAVEIYRNWDEVKGVFVAVWNDIGAAAASFGKWFMGWVKDIFGEATVTYVSGFMRGLGNMIGNIWSGVLGLLGTIKGKIYDMMISVAGALGMKETEQALHRLRGASDGMAAGFKNSALSVNATTSSLQGAAESTARLDAITQKYANSLTLGKTTVDEVKKKTGELLKLQQDGFTALAKLQNDYKQGLVSAADFQIQEGKLKASLANTRNLLEQVEGKVGSVGTAFRRMGDDGEKGAKKAEGAINATLLSMGDLLRKAAQTGPDFATKFAGHTEKAVALIKEMTNEVEHIREKYALMGKAVPEEIQKVIDRTERAIQNQRIWVKATQFKEMIDGAEALADSVNKVSNNFKNIATDTSGIDSIVKKMDDLKRRIREDLGMKNVDPRSLLPGNGTGAGVTPDDDEFTVRLKNARKTYRDMAALGGEHGRNEAIMAQARQKIYEYEIAARVGGIQRLGTEFQNMGASADAIIKRLSMGGTVDEMLNTIDLSFQKILETTELTSGEQVKIFLEGEREKQRILQESLRTMAGSWAGSGEFFNGLTKSMGQNFKLNVIDAVDGFGRKLGESMQTTIDGLFSGDWSKAKSGLQAIADDFQNIWKLVLEPVKALVSDFFKGINEEITGTIKNEIIGKFFPAMKGSEAQANSFGEALANMFKKGTKAGTDSAEALSKSMTAAGDSFKEASASISKSAESISKNATNGVSSLTKFASTITMVTGVISAVMDVLQYLQMRRMEQDIGRIEVTSRGVLNEALNFRKVFEDSTARIENTKWPELINVLQDSHDRKMELMTRILDVLQNGLSIIGVAPVGAPTGSPGSTGGSSPSQGLGGGVRNPVPGLPSVSTGASGTVNYTEGSPDPATGGNWTNVRDPLTGNVSSVLRTPNTSRPQADTQTTDTSSREALYGVKTGLNYEQFQRAGRDRQAAADQQLGGTDIGDLVKAGHRINELMVRLPNGMRMFQDWTGSFKLTVDDLGKILKVEAANISTMAPEWAAAYARASDARNRANAEAANSSTQIVDALGNTVSVAGRAVDNSEIQLSDVSEQFGAAITSVGTAASYGADGSSFTIRDSGVQIGGALSYMGNTIRDAAKYTYEQVRESLYGPSGLNTITGTKSTNFFGDAKVNLNAPAEFDPNAGSGKASYGLTDNTAAQQATANLAREHEYWWSNFVNANPTSGLPLGMPSTSVPGSDPSTGVNSGASMNLTVNVNNADAKRVSDVMVDNWRRRGVDI